MRSKYTLLPVLLLSMASVLQAVDFTWPGHGTIGFDVPAGWRIEGQPAEDVGYSFRARPDAGVAAFLQITLVSLPADKPIAVAELPERLHASLLPYIEQSVEKEFRPVVLKSRHGKGWYAELTDAALVGKPSVPDDFKIMRSALIAVDQQTLVIATMQFDDPAMDAPGEMLAIVGSLRFDHATTAEPARK